jgi:hypothetical protein
MAVCFYLGVTDSNRPAAHTPTPSTTLGSMNYSFCDGAWTAETFDVTVDGAEWTVSLTIEDNKVALYAWNYEGDNLHGPAAFVPSFTVGAAIRLALRAR